MKDCDGIEELLSAYADGEAGEGERRRVEGHLALCGACRLRMRWINATKAGLSGLSSPSLPPDLEARLLEEARGEGLPGRGQALPRRAAWSYGLAAGLALAALAVAVRLPDWGEEVPLEAMLAAHHQYAASLPSTAPERGLPGPGEAADD